MTGRNERNRHGKNPALKHGAYSGMTLLPGESAAAFQSLRDTVISELNPIGAVEEDIVLSIARLMWRKQNLMIYRLADQARKVLSACEAEHEPEPGWIGTLAIGEPDRSDVLAGQQAAREQAQKELGPAWKLIDISEASLLDELAVVDRLDGMIDRCLKRLLFVRGIKSLDSSVAAPSQKKIRAA